MIFFLFFKVVASIFYSLSRFPPFSLKCYCSVSFFLEIFLFQLSYICILARLLVLYFYHQKLKRNNKVLLVYCKISKVVAQYVLGDFFSRWGPLLTGQCWFIYLTFYLETWHSKLIFFFHTFSTTYLLLLDRIHIYT